MSLSDVITGDNYRKIALPALGILEALATHGRSPGTAAMGQMQAYDKEQDEQYTKGRQAKLDEQTAAKDAIQSRLGNLQIENTEIEGQDRLAQKAKVSALQDAMKLRGIAPAVAANDKQLESLFYGAYPEKYGEKLKPETNVYLPGANGYYVAPKTGTPSATTLKDEGGATVVPPPKPSQKSLAEIEAEAAARAAGTASAAKPAQNQSAAAGYGKRAILAQTELDSLISGGFDPGAGVGMVENLLPSAAQSGPRQQFNNAKENFISAVLRKESGASISPTERSSAESLYFPQPGDRPETIEQKTRARAAAIASLQAEAGTAWDAVASVGGAVWRKAKDGKEYEYNAATKKPTGKSR